jgi:L-lysine exporter family protein LysE/ArgO
MFVLIGILIGFSAAIPLGPVNVFVVSQALKHHPVHGILAGLTTACLDFLFCLVTLVGFFHMSFNFDPYLPWMKGGATLLLAGLGMRLIHQSKQSDLKARPGIPVIKPTRPILGVIALYFSNPTIYAFWIAVAGTATAHHLVVNRGWVPVVFAISCGLGSLVWYLLLVRYVARHQHKIRQESFQKLLFIMGIVLIGFGIFTFVTIFA